MTTAVSPPPQTTAKRLALRLALIPLVMFGFGFALVPLYDLLCQITGLGGRTNSVPMNLVATADPTTPTVAREIVVEFIANVPADATWDFVPEVARMTVIPGEFYRVNYVAKNRRNYPTAGQAVPSVAPGLAARHFQKIQCFCFERQEFAAQEERVMPVAFRVDPQVDPKTQVITLSYTFFELTDS